MALQPDYKDILQAFADFNVEYLVVGGYAVGAHGVPRFTKDLDLWIRPSPANLALVRSALVAFGAPEVLLSQLEGATLDDVLWMGVPPVRIDLLKGLPGGDFLRAWSSRVTEDWDGVAVQLVSRAELIALKRASGRPQDLIDVEKLEAL